MFRCYCVLRISDGQIEYHGCGVNQAARALEKGTVFGWGPDFGVSLADARRRLSDLQKEWKRIAALKAQEVIRG